MGLFGNMLVAMELRKLNGGRTAMLSTAQITRMITNMPDAQKNLSQEEFEQVYILFQKLSSDTVKKKMDLDGYYDEACRIIRLFDALAPYEKYTDGDPIKIMIMLLQLEKEDLQALAERADRLVCSYAQRSKMGPVEYCRYFWNKELEGQIPAGSLDNECEKRATAPYASLALCRHYAEKLSLSIPAYLERCEKLDEV